MRLKSTIFSLLLLTGLACSTGFTGDLVETVTYEDSVPSPEGLSGEIGSQGPGGETGPPGTEGEPGTAGTDLSETHSNDVEVPKRDGCDLVWNDEFEEDGLPDPSNWYPELVGPGWNQELQFYTEARAKNARVEDGRLIIEAHNEDWLGMEYTSARLGSKMSWTYGRFEASAKLPSGRGTWPAIWLLPDHQQRFQWPEGGEIDIMEHVGHLPDRIHATVHTEAYNHRKETQKGASIHVPTARTEYNLYAVEWTPSKIDAFVNDDRYFSFENERLKDSSADNRHWPFDHPFHLILNVAVGGSWGGAQGVDPDIWPQQMEIDFVRVYDCGE